MMVLIKVRTYTDTRQLVNYVSTICLDNVRKIPSRKDFCSLSISCNIPCFTKVLALYSDLELSIASFVRSSVSLRLVTTVRVLVVVCTMSFAVVTSQFSEGNLQ